MAALSLIHVHPKPSWSWRLLQYSLWARCSPEILQPPNNLQHGCEGDSACVSTQAGMWTNAIMDIGFERSIDAHGVRVREDLRIAVGGDLSMY